MHQLSLYITQHLDIAPVIIFLALTLAGFNIPISEDAMLFIAGYIAAENPHLTTHLFLAVYLGAYAGDLICFGLGHTLGPKLWDNPFFNKIAKRHHIVQVEKYYAKYGVWTMIIGRFIPFGVRNALFLTAGLVRMNVLRFALADLLACTLSTSVFFSLYYTYGENVIAYIKKGNAILFSIFAIILLMVFVVKKSKKVRAVQDDHT